MSQEERKKELENLTIDQLVKLAKDEHGMNFPSKPSKPEAVATLLELEKEKLNADLATANQKLIAENTALKEENEQLKTDKAELEGKNKALSEELVTAAEFIDERDDAINVLEEENKTLKANQPAKADAEALETKEDINLGTGDNVVNVSTVIGLDSRMRAGFTFTRKIATYYLSDDELAAIKADNHLIIHGEVTKREVE